jgi:hypothetical protein
MSNLPTTELSFTNAKLAGYVGDEIDPADYGYLEDEMARYGLPMSHRWRSWDYTPYSVYIKLRDLGLKWDADSGRLYSGRDEIRKMPPMKEGWHPKGAKGADYWNGVHSPLLVRKAAS